MKAPPLPAASSVSASSSAKELNQRRDRARPSGLVAGAEARAVVAVEVLVEEEVVAPVRVLLERLRAAVDRPSPGLVLEEDPREAIGDLLGDLEEIHHPAGARRAFHLEAVAVVA